MDINDHLVVTCILCWLIALILAIIAGYVIGKSLESWIEFKDKVETFNKKLKHENRKSCNNSQP